jgi:hypothetical protein
MAVGPAGAGGGVTTTVIARLDRAIQYQETLKINGEAAAYWITRFRG